MGKFNLEDMFFQSLVKLVNILFTQSSPKIGIFFGNCLVVLIYYVNNGILICKGMLCGYLLGIFIVIRELLI